MMSLGILKPSVDAQTVAAVPDPMRTNIEAIGVPAQSCHAL